MIAGQKEGRLIIVSAPSGAGKTTIVKYILGQGMNIRFSVSATTRPARKNEKEGREYYFLTGEEFLNRIARDEFLEYEEVYEGCFYGTLKSEVDNILNSGSNVIFDIDVMGGLNIKRIYEDRALAIFIMPPDVTTLEQRLVGRGSESKESLEKRIEKAKWEISFAGEFDIIIVNDQLNRAEGEALKVVHNFLAG
jgi:guanylate kinase